MKTNRVIVVYGSETNGTKNEMTKIVDQWKENTKSGFTVVDFLEGDEAADKFSDINTDNYDFILVGTSSFGEGDPPNGFGKFVYQLQEAAKKGTKPFQGLQHSVIGFGSTSFETFQNCPRLTDKYLGEAGSRRCLKRVEVDENEYENEKTIATWIKEISKICVDYTMNGDKLDPVCEWTEPDDVILKKILGENGYEIGYDLPQMDYNKIMFFSAVVFTGVAAYYWNFHKQNLD